MSRVGKNVLAAVSIVMLTFFLGACGGGNNSGQVRSGTAAASNAKSLPAGQPPPSLDGANDAPIPQMPTQEAASEETRAFAERALQLLPEGYALTQVSNIALGDGNPGGASADYVAADGVGHVFLSWQEVNGSPVPPAGTENLATRSEDSEGTTYVSTVKPPRASVAFVSTSGLEINIGFNYAFVPGSLTPPTGTVGGDITSDQLVSIAKTLASGDGS